MPNGLIIGEDKRVAEWAYNTFRRRHTPYDMAVGVVNSDRRLVGAIILHSFNGANIELSYYGPNTMSPGIVRSVARLLIGEFDVSRVTIVISKRDRHLLRSFGKLGPKIEGTMRCYYGHKDNWRNTGVRFVMFREALELIAALPGRPSVQKQG